MHRLQSISHSTALYLAFAGLLGAVSAMAQVADRWTANDASVPQLQASSDKLSSHPSFLPGCTSPQSNEDALNSVTDLAPARPFEVQSGWKAIQTFAGYTFTAPGSHLFPGAAYDADSGNYSSSLSARATAYLTNTKSTSANLTADLEIDGSTGQGSESPQATGQDLTVEWGVSRLFSSDKHPARAMEIGVAGYQEWMVSRPLSLGGPFAGRVPGYSVFTAGLEATFTLPEKNTTFSLRYGHGNLVGGQSLGRMFAVEISWAW